MSTTYQTTDQTILLAQKLIRIDSVTPEDKGCQDILCDRLSALGFHIENLHWQGVDNFWAEIGNDDGPTFCFAGHTDVVPAGEEDKWQRAPFSGEVEGDYLYGRGAADMKGSLAAMITACESFFAEGNSFKGKLAFLITSDEEGMAEFGTRKVMEWLAEQNKRIDYCVIGEPSSTSQLGDIVKNGRRGSLNAWLTINGLQGHVAYPHKAQNPIHLLAPALNELVNMKWDSGNQFFPATSFQISNINSGTGATNVIPGSVEMMFNFRYSTETTAEELQQTVLSVLDKHELDYKIDWQLSGKPFITEPGALTEAIASAIEQETGRQVELSTTGGTSDGRFIAPYGVEVAELGPLNETIHKVDECVSVSDLINLSKIYQQIVKKLLLP